MSGSYRNGSWKVRKSRRRVHAYPEVVNSRGDVICAVYAGQACADYIADLPLFKRCLKRLLTAAVLSAQYDKPFDIDSPAIEAARELLEMHS